MAEPIKMPLGLWTRVSPRYHVLDGESRSPHAKGQFFGERTCRGMPDNTLPWAVQKWLNRSRCLGCGLQWAQGSMSYIGCTLAQPGKYGWTVQVRRRCGLFVKLLWSLVISHSFVLGFWEWYCWLGSM